MSTSITLSTLQNTLSPVVKKAYNEGAKSVEVLYPKFMNVINSDEYYYEALEVSQLGLLQEINELEDMPKLDITLGSTKQYIPVSYAGRVSASRLSWKFDRLNIIKQASAGLGKMAKKTPDVQITNYIEAGDDTYTTPDGQYVFSRTHINLAGGTYANRPAAYSELSYTALNDAYQAMAITKRHGVIPGNNSPKYIMFHPALASKIHAILKSEKVPGGNNNDSNYYMDRLIPIENNMFTNTKLWMLLSEKDMHALNIIYWTNPQMIKWIKDSNQEMNWAVVTDYNFGAASGLGMYMQNPA